MRNTKELIVSVLLLFAFGAFGGSLQHSLDPAGVYHVNNTTSAGGNLWADRNAQHYPRAVAGVFTRNHRAFDGENGRGLVFGGTGIQDSNLENGYPCDIPGEINSKTPAGTVLKDGYIYTVTESTTVTAEFGQNGLVVDEGSTAVLYIPEGITLKVRGGDDNEGMYRSYAGIRLPSSSTLVICGQGHLEAYSGLGGYRAYRAPAGIGCGGAAGKETSGSAAAIGGNGCMPDDQDTTQADMGKLFVMGHVSVMAYRCYYYITYSAVSGGDPGLFCTSELIAPTFQYVYREPDAHADTHWAVRYDVTIRDDDGSELAATKATLSMFYEPISPPVREDMLFLGCTNRVGKLVIGPLGGSPNVCTTPGAHEVYAVWILGVNTTDDPPIEEISFDDDIVSLREIIYRISQGGRGRPLPCPLPVPISPTLTKAGDTRELVLTLRDEPLRPALPADTPIRIDGRLARGRPLVIDGGGGRSTPLFSLTNETGLILQNVTVRNAFGAVDGIAVQAATNTTSLVVSNVLFAALDPGAGNRCVRADGRTRVQQTSWFDCTGIPISLGPCGEQSLMVESTVVPKGASTEKVRVGVSGAVMACTIPSGVEIDAGGQVIGSITEPITEKMCDPVTALSTNVYKVTQYYYQVIPSNEDLVGPGKGCFIWHDADWRNVAYSDKPFDPRTAVFGAADRADDICLYDVRGLLIQYLWNTRGSYAVHWATPPLVVNTTKDQSLAEMNLVDDVVSLREALQLIQILPVVRNPDGTPNKITFADALFDNAGRSARIPLNHGTLSVADRIHVTDAFPIWLCGPSGGRTLTVDGMSTIDGTYTNILSLAEDVHLRASDMAFEYGQSSGNNSDGAAITSKGCLQALERCTFANNRGSAVWIDQDPLVVRECTFRNNGGDEWESGGAIHQWNSCGSASRGTGVVTVVDSVFEKNVAQNGGAICAYGEICVENSTFTENRQVSDRDRMNGGGGAIHIENRPLTIRNSYFLGNQAQVDGGAILLMRDDSARDIVKITGSEFVGNSAGLDGGAISSRGAVELWDTVFATNTARYGGAGWMTTGALTAERCRFEGNSAQMGGALRFISRAGGEGGIGTGGSEGGAIFIGETTFVGNAAKGKDAGALSIEARYNNVPARLVTVVNASFLDNTASTRAGAICQGGCDMLLANVTFRGNSTAEGSGGAYFGWSGYGGQLALVNVIASGNKAGGDAETDDFALEETDGFIGCASAIKAIKGVTSMTASRFIAGNAASESSVYKYATAAKSVRVKLANGTVQTSERLRPSNAAIHAGATIEHDAAWTNVVCTLSGASSYVLRGKSALVDQRVRTDITGRTYPLDTVPSMGCLWDVDDPPSKYVTTLLDVEDSRDGLTSLREAVENLKTSQEWRDALYNSDFRAYEVLFDKALRGTMKLQGCLEISALDDVAVFVRVPWDRELAIDGGGVSRAFKIDEGAILDLANLTITNCCGMAYGQMTYNGGAIENGGTLNVSNVAFYACTAGPTNTAPIGKGGAVYAKQGATMRLRGCTFAGCTAACGGAIAAEDECSLTVCNSTFVGNAVRNDGYISVSRGNAVYAEGADTDALFAQCTFALNVGSDHAGTDGGGAVFINNADTQAARVSFVNSVLVGNGQYDLATSGRVRLVGSVYGVRWGGSSSDDPWCEAYSKYVTHALTTADVYAHTTADGTPEASWLTSGGVRHVVVPLLEGSNLPSVWLRADLGWAVAGWGSTTDRIDDVFRGNRFAALYAPLWNADLAGATTTTNWMGALIARESKTKGEPVPGGPVPGVVTEPTYENFAATVKSAMTAISDEIVITLADNVRGKTIAFEKEIKLTSPCHVTIRGPLTLDADGYDTRFFTLGPGVTLTLVGITLKNGNMANGDFPDYVGGAVYLDGPSTGSSLASLVAYDCTFENCSAQAGGVVYANGLACSETFVRCTFTGNDAEVGAVICHDDMNLKLTDTAINLDDIWPRPAVALEVGTGAFALYADTCDDQSEAALKSVVQIATTEAGKRGVSGRVKYLSFAAAKAAGGKAAVEAMTPVAEEFDLTQVTGDGDEKVVTLTPKNVVPYLWYALEHAETPVGPYTVEEGGWVQANPDGTLPKALTAPAKGARGFYRIVVRE